jgi:hypothetical protein
LLRCESFAIVDISGIIVAKKFFSREGLVDDILWKFQVTEVKHR